MNLYYVTPTSENMGDRCVYADSFNYVPEDGVFYFWRDRDGKNHTVAAFCKAHVQSIRRVEASPTEAAEALISEYEAWGGSFVIAFHNDSTGTGIRLRGPLEVQERLANEALATVAESYKSVAKTAGA